MITIVDSPKKPLLVPVAIRPYVRGFWDTLRLDDVVYAFANVLPDNMGRMELDANLDGIADGWVATSDSAVGISASISNTQVLRGTASQKVVSDGSNPVANNHRLEYVFNTVSGHRYFGMALVRTSVAGKARVQLGGYTATSTGTGWALLACLFEADGTLQTLQIYGAYNNAGTAVTTYINKVMLFDLTTIFGEDLEPAVTDCGAIIAADATYYWDTTRNVKCNPRGRHYIAGHFADGIPMKVKGLSYNATSNLQPGLLTLDGIDDYGASISILLDINSAPLAAFAIVCLASDWAGGGYVVCRNLNAAANIQYALSINAELRCVVSLEGSVIATSEILAVNTFYDIGFYWDGAIAKLFINAYSGISGPYAGVLTSQPHLFLGCLKSGTEHFKGDLKNVAIYAGTGLTLDAVLAHRRQIMRRHGVS